jgi:formylglycine-generating enzyme required for sulfatase activity
MLQKDVPAGKDDEEAETNMPAVSVKNSIGMEFVLIPAGDFWMYSSGSGHEEQIHKVIISRPFYLGKYLVTQREWESVMSSHPSCFEGDDRPVECVSWNDVQDFVNRLNSKEDTDKYRLPSEAEWEYACRAGTNTIYSFGNADSKLSEYAWYYDNSQHMTHPVGQKKPNFWGLYDMHGNVWEWCQDISCIHNIHSYSPVDSSCRAAGSISGMVLRGGGWVSYARKCRSAYRSSFNPAYGCYSLGFRLVMSV